MRWIRALRTGCERALRALALSSGAVGAREQTTSVAGERSALGFPPGQKRKARDNMLLRLSVALPRCTSSTSMRDYGQENCDEGGGETKQPEANAADEGIVLAIEAEIRKTAHRQESGGRARMR